jgi:diaminopropionate ammonia-lyase
METHLGRSLEPWRTIDELHEKLASVRPLTLVTATDGNHGRAVARVAALFGFDAQIYVPGGTASARIDGIASEGARVVVVDGTYEDAVARAAEDASESCLVVSDTSWPGYEEIPRWVAEGYSTIMSETDDELAKRGETTPNLIAIQFGVGALAAAVVRHYRQARVDKQLKIVSVEPLHAACALASMEADEIVTVPGPHDSIMAGLNCGRVSMHAWPIVSRSIDAFIAIPDERACEAMRALARVGIIAGETGAAGLAGLFELLMGAESARYREALGVNRSTRVLVIVTEGATDPENYRRIVGS